MNTRSPLARLLLSLPLALTLFAPNASAAFGVNLSWNACYGDAGAAQNRVFACDTNLGQHTLHGSFQLDVPLAQAIGIEAVIDLRSETATLPAWWRFAYAGSCRQNSLVPTFQPDAGATACVDWANLEALGGIIYCTMSNPTSSGCATYHPGADQAVLKVISAVPPAAAQDLAANQTYFAFTLSIDNAFTTGGGSCDGCSTPVCLVLNSIVVFDRDNVPRGFLISPTAPGSDTVTWQGTGPICPVVTSARTSTWGAVKALYR